jgi:hypothetical protein
VYLFDTAINIIFHALFRAFPASCFRDKFLVSANSSLKPAFKDNPAHADASFNFLIWLSKLVQKMILMTENCHAPGSP